MLGAFLCTERGGDMIPDKVNVVGIDYQIKEVPFIEIDSNRNYQGACRYGETTIEILDSLSVSRKEQVFIHELTYAIFNEAGYDEQDEDVINRIAIVLYQVLKDNNLSLANRR